MKILIVMAGFFPGQKFGGPPVSVDNFCSLMEKHECYIVTRNHDMGEKEIYHDVLDGWNDRGNCKVLYLSDSEYGYRNYEKIIHQIKPDIIYLQGLFQNCIIPCLFLAKKYNIRVLLAPRGELCKGAFKKKYKKIPYIIFLKVLGLIKNVSFQSTSDEETEAIHKILDIEMKRIYFMTNVPSIPKIEMKHDIKQKGTARFVFLSRIVAKKNLDYALNLMNFLSGNVVFDVYGTIEDEKYWAKCQEIIEQLPANIVVTYKGSISHEMVHETLIKYDAFVFPTHSENFGHVMIEALSVGCPVVISDQVPWIDVESYNAGWSLALLEKDKYVDALQTIVDCDNEEEGQMRQGAIEYFKEKMKLDELRKRYDNALNGGNV